MTSITITGFITYKGVSYVPGQVVSILSADARALVNAGYAKFNDGGGGGTGGTTDTTAPSAPATVTAAANSATSVTVTWTASTDAVGVTGYRIFRGATQIGTVGVALTYTDGSASPSTAYVYSVRAVDAAGNASQPGTAASITTPAAQAADTTPPSAPTTVGATANSSTSVVVTWAASTDASGVTGYRVFRNGTLIGTTTLALTFTDSGATASTTYTYSVRALDPAGNLSAAGTAAAVTTPATASGGGGLTQAEVDARIVALALPRWKPNTAYTAGQTVINPSGNSVTALVNLTSGATYSAANWSDPVANLLANVQITTRYATVTDMQNDLANQPVGAFVAAGA